MKKILLAICALSLVGCATRWDIGIEEQNTQRVTSHNISQSNQTMYRVNAISDIAGGYDCNDPDSKDCGAAQAMMRYRSMEAIEAVKGEQYAGPVGKTGVDVQDNIADNAAIISVVTGGTISTVSAHENSSGDVTNTNNGSGNLNNSYDEDHATNFGDESSASNYPNQDNSTTAFAGEEE